MLRIWLTIMMLWTVGSAASINWEKDYRTALTKAKMTKKPVMLVISSHKCRYCVKLEEETFSNDILIKALNRDFISVTAYTDENDYFPQELWSGGTPATWFLYPDGEPMFQPLVGFLDAENFINALSIVHTEFNKTKK
ncbi:MAG: thioredoxin family protein [Campylobacterota bacterium]|nr:thioredoxin family protein [Campylobacterota bacterium]